MLTKGIKVININRLYFLLYFIEDKTGASCAKMVLIEVKCLQRNTHVVLGSSLF